MILSVYSVELSWTTGNVLQLRDGVNRVGHKATALLMRVHGGNASWSHLFLLQVSLEESLRAAACRRPGLRNRSNTVS